MSPDSPVRVSLCGSGTSLDSHVVYKIYRRVDDGLPHMI